jgi:hypothetical protein
VEVEEVCVGGLAKPRQPVLIITSESVAINTADQSFLERFRSATKIIPNPGKHRANKPYPPNSPAVVLVPMAFKVSFAVTGLVRGVITS